MKKKIKLLVSLAGFFLSLAVLAFGVIAGINVTYVAQGVVNYQIEDAYVSIETRVYSTSKKFTSQKEFEDVSKEIEHSGFEKLNSQETLDTKYNFKKVQIKETATPSTFEEKPQNYVDTYTNKNNDIPPQDLTLNLDYLYKSDVRAMGYFVVIKVTNESPFRVYTSVKTAGEEGDENIYKAPSNSFVYKTQKIEILKPAEIGKEFPSTYICFSMGLDDSGWEMDGVAFNYPIEVKQDEDGSFDKPYVANTLNTYKTTSEISKTLDTTGVTLESVPAMVYPGVTGYSLINLNLPASSLSIDITLSMSITMGGMFENLTSLITDVSAVFAKCLTIEECLANQDILVPDVAVMSDDETYMSANIPSAYLSSTESTDITIIISIPADKVEELNTMQIPGFDFTLTSSKEGSTASAMLTNYEWSMVDFVGMGEAFTTPIQVELNEFAMGSDSLSFFASIRNYQIRNIPDGTEAVNITFETSEKVQVVFAVEGQKEALSIADVMLFMEGEIETISGVQNGGAVINLPVSISEDATMDFYICMFYYQTSVSDSESIELSLKVDFAELDTSSTPLDLILETDSYFNIYYVVNGIKDTSATDIVVPAYYKNIVVKELNDNAFISNKTIKNVTFEPNSQIDQLSSSAFADCSNLKSVTFGANSKITSILSYTFQNCTSLSSITLPDSITSIDSYAFQNCTSLQSITIPDNVTTLGQYMFNGCSKLETVTFAANTQITSFPNNIFQNCTSLKTIQIPNAVTSIGGSAFYGCTGLTSITIPENVTSVSSKAFYNCTALQEINWNAKRLSSGVNSTSDIFYNAGLNSATDTCAVTFGANVQAVPSYLFYVSNTSYYPRITKVEFTSQTGTTVGSNVFQNCSALKTAIISKGVTSIGTNTFNNCYNLDTVTFDANATITSLSNYLFQKCSQLKSITIPNSVTSIGSNTFNNCSALTQITIPQNVKTIGSYAFQNCTNIEIINWNATSLTTTLSSSSNVFSSVGSNSATEECIVNVGSTVQSIPNNLFYSSSTETYPRITQVNISQGATVIGTYAFYGCVDLETVNIANSITTIGESAFYGCTSIIQIVIPDSVTTIGANTFKNTSNSTLFDFRSATDIPTLSGTGAFDGVGSTAIIYVPTDLYFDWVETTNWSTYEEIIYADNVEVVDGPGVYNSTTGEMLMSWSDLEKSGAISVNDGVLAINQAIDVGVPLKIELDDSVTEIPNSLFNQASGLASIIIPSSVTVIGEQAFVQCQDLQEVIIQNAACSIGQGAFAGCVGLQKLDIGSNITEIGLMAFAGCIGGIISESLYIGPNTIVAEGAFMASGIKAFDVDPANATVKDIDGVLYSKDETILIQWPCAKIGVVSILDSVTAFGIGAFLYTTGVTGEIVVPDAVTSIAVPLMGAIAIPVFGYCSMSSIRLPNGLTELLSNCFVGCSNLETINFPANLITIGESAFEDCTSLEMDIVIPNSVTTIGKKAFSGCIGIKSVTIGTECTSIGMNAFYGCTNLKNLVIGSKVQSIGTEAFRGSGLTCKLTIPDSVTTIGSYSFTSTGITGLELGASLGSIGTAAFQYCSNMSGSIIIPNSTTFIGNYAFQDCSKITSLTIGTSVQTIGDLAFYGCPDIDSTLTLPSTLTSIGQSAFNGLTKLKGDIVIPSGVTSIGLYAFKDCSSLTSLTAGSDGISMTIADQAFYNCTGLTSITLQGGITSIGESAFYNCNKAIGTLNIPNFVTTISNNAFQNCSGLTGLVLGSSVQTIGDNAFYGCTNIAGSLSLPDTLTSIGQTAFRNLKKLTGILTIPNSTLSVGAYAFQDCTGFSSLVLGNGVTTVGDNAFYGCTGFTSMSLGTSLQTIGQSAFRNCSNVTGTITLSAIITIGNYAFHTASKVTTFIIGGTITQIGDGVFANCTSATRFDFTACTSVPTLTNTNGFKNISESAKIYVSQSLHASWIAAANWSDWASYITY